MFKYLFVATIILFVSFMLVNREENIMEETKGEILKLPYESKGSKDAKVMLVFLHGYPNTVRMWDEIIAKLDKDFLCVSITYPNYSKELRRSWGMDLVEIVELIKQTIFELEKEHNQQYKKVFVGHDWGAVFSYLFDEEHPGSIDQMVTLDVGTGIEEGVKSKVMAFSYQSFLAANFLIGGRLGNTMTNLFVDKFVRDIGYPKSDFKNVNSSMNYPYYYLYRNLFFYLRKFKNYNPSCPVSYIYGEKKPFMFHSKRFIDTIAKNKDSEVKSVPAGHWLMEKFSNLIVETIRKRARTLIK